MTIEPLIRVQDLGKHYETAAPDTPPALSKVNVSIGAGEFVAVMGPSGSGKSTFMNLLGCLDVPTSGAYFLNGRNVADLSVNELADIRNRQLGFVFQGFNLLQACQCAGQRGAAVALRRCQQNGRDVPARKNC